jgi:predicted transcriptional regulator of viral defense system
MNKLTEQVFNSMPYGHFTSQDVATLFPGSEDRRYGLVKRAIAQGQILHIRRGLYCLAPKYQKINVSVYALAERIYGPSYISLESALSWHGWIPEAVHAVTSASFKKSKEFSTPLGVFSFERVPQKLFYAEVVRHTDESGSVFLMANPLKALADYIYVLDKNWTGVEPLIDSLRIEREEFEQITRDSLECLSSNYTDTRVRKFLEGIRKDLKL